MSETVHYKGDANIVNIPEGKTLVQVAEDILKKKDPLYEIPSYSSGPLEYLCDRYYEEYFFHSAGQTLYKITKKEVDVNRDIIEAYRKHNGMVEYELRYYNGGAGFGECLGEAMDKLIKEEEEIYKEE